MLAAAAGPSVLALEALDRFKWKAPEGRLVAVLNPEWVNAPYEIAFAYIQPRPWMNGPKIPLPLRFKTLEEACSDEGFPVPPYILKRL